MKFRIFITLTLFISVIKGYGSVKTDSLKFSFLQSDDFVYDENYDKYIFQAFYYIDADSLRRGFKLLAKGVSNKNKIEHIYRAADYGMLELCNFLELYADGKLSAAGDTVFIHLFTQLFKSNQINFKPVVKLIPRKEKQSALYLRLQAFCSFLERNYFDTNIYLKKWLELKPNSLEANVLKAYLFYLDDHYVESIKQFTHVINLYPQYAYGYYIRAKCYEELGRKDEAGADYKRTLELFPEYAKALNGYGVFCMEHKEMEKAISCFKKAIEISPYFDWPYNNLGLTYNKIEKYDSALYYLEKAIILDPDDAKSYNNRGDAYYGKKDYVNAVKDYTESFALRPNYKFYYADRGDAFFFFGDFDKAIEDFKAAVYLDENYSYALRRLGDCYYTKADYPKAVRYATKALQLDSKYYIARYLRAMSYMRMEQYNAAIDEFLEVIRMNPTYANAYGYLGRTYYCTGNYPMCIQYSQKTIRLDENTLYAKFNIALSYLRLGVMDEAKRLYTQFYEESLSKKEDISGAVSDLEDLINQNIRKEDAEYILKNILKR